MSVSLTSIRMGSNLIHAAPQVLHQARRFSLNHASFQGRTTQATDLIIPPIQRRDHSFDARKISTERSALSYIVAAIVASSIFISLSSWVKTPSTVMGVVSTDKLEEELAIEQKQAALWECIGREPAPYGGYIYLYKQRAEFIDRLDAVSKKEADIFPALEPFNNENYFQFMVNGHFTKEFQELGYKFDPKSGILGLPDEVALEAGFEKINESHPYLKPWKLCVSEGVADSLSYIKAYLEYDALLSTSKEFVHDHTGHLMTTFYNKLANRKYDREKERVREIVSSILLKIEFAEKEGLFKEDLPKMNTKLESTVDYLWGANLSTLRKFRRTFENPRFDTLDHHGDVQAFWMKTHGEWHDGNKLNKIWQQFLNLEPHD